MLKFQGEHAMDDLSNMFEIEFCLKREIYCEIYHEDGLLWDKLHKEHVDLFHKLFKEFNGRVCIMDDLQVLFWTYFKDKDSFYYSFMLDEFSEKELRFLRITISDLNPKIE